MSTAVNTGYITKLEDHKNTNMMRVALAHEIKNPVAIAVAYLGLIQRLNMPEEAQGYCNHIQDALYDISEMVHELLYFENEKLSPPQAIHIGEIIADITQEYHQAMPEALFSVNTEVPMVCAGPGYGHIRLIFSNLLKNALENSDGAVAIYASQTGAFLRIAIHNNICSFGGSTPSSGMGLNICHWLVTQAGGTLQLETTPENRHVATVTLPIWEDMKIS